MLIVLVGVKYYPLLSTWKDNSSRASVSRKSGKNARTFNSDNDADRPGVFLRSNKASGI